MDEWVVFAQEMCTLHHDAVIMLCSIFVTMLPRANMADDSSTGRSELSYAQSEDRPPSQATVTVSGKVQETPCSQG